MFTLDRYERRQDNPFIKKKIPIQFDTTLHNSMLTHLTHNFNQCSLVVWYANLLTIYLQFKCLDLRSCS